MPPFHSSVCDASELASLLREGSPALFSTDTLPALAACPQYSNQLWRLKQRPLDKPLILMGADPEHLFEWVMPIALKDAKQLSSIHWPGALTMVLPAFGNFLEALNPGETTLGMRVPACENARALLNQIGPLATTSANISGKPPSTSAQIVAQSFPDVPLLGPLPWPTTKGLASTVIRWQGPGCWNILRSGGVILKNF